MTDGGEVGLQIPLNGRIVLIDDEDAGLLAGKKLKVLATKNRVYPALTIYDRDVGSRTVTLGRFLMGMPADREVHYKNGDTFDNRRVNLFVVPRTACAQSSQAEEGVYEGLERTPMGWLVRVNGRVFGEYALLGDARKVAAAALKRTKTAYLGVNRKGNRYAAVYVLNGRRMVLGVYDTPEEAARAYDRMARYMNPKAPLNFPGEHCDVPVAVLDRLVKIPSLPESLVFP